MKKIEMHDRPKKNRKYREIRGKEKGKNYILDIHNQKHKVKDKGTNFK